MTATESPAWVQASIHLAGDASPVNVPGLVTAVPELVITPTVRRGEDGNLRVSDRWTLTHRPTGKTLPSPIMGADPGTLTTLVENVADLDWSLGDGITEEHRNRYFAAMRDLDGGVDPSPFDQPLASSWGGPGIPRQATPLLTQLLDWWQDENQRRQDFPFKLPDGAPNPAYYDSIHRQVDLYGLAYLLGTLITHVPDIADEVSASLVDAWDAGDSLGEWVWEWRQQLKAGEPLRLPGVPTPEPVALLTSPGEGSR